MSKGRGYNPRGRMTPPSNEEEMKKAIDDEFQYAEAALELDEVPIMPAKETKTIKPTYNFGRNENGKPSVQNISQNEVEQIDDNKISIAKEMLEAIEKEILKTQVEIEIHQKIVNSSRVVEEISLNERRIESFHNNLEYLTKKKNILIKIVQSSE